MRWGRRQGRWRRRRVQRRVPAGDSRAEDSDIRDVDDLSGRTVAVAKGTPGEENVEGETDAGRVRKFPEGPDVVDVVRVRLVDAAVVEVQLAQDAVATLGWR